MNSAFRTLLGLSALATLVACDQSDASAPDPLRQELDTLRALTKRFESIATARAAGYDVKVTDCMADAAGAMGFHYGNAALIDGTVNALEPEVMMYEPLPSGQLQLVGVEYVVPLNAWTAAAPPQLYGQTFQRNDMFQVWALHAWVWKDNPRGTFASWNPSVTCAHANAVR
jgi:hypothetical protein